MDWLIGDIKKAIEAGDKTLAKKAKCSEINVQLQFHKNLDDLRVINLVMSNTNKYLVERTTNASQQLEPDQSDPETGTKNIASELVAVLEKWLKEMIGKSESYAPSIVFRLGVMYFQDANKFYGGNGKATIANDKAMADASTEIATLFADPNLKPYDVKTPLLYVMLTDGVEKYGAAKIEAVFDSFFSICAGNNDYKGVYRLLSVMIDYFQRHSNVTGDALEIMFYCGKSIEYYRHKVKEHCFVDLEHYGELALKKASKQGHKGAKSILTEGTGALPEELAQLIDSDVACRVSDITGVVHIEIKKESAKAYKKALEFLINLFKNRFKKEYQIELKSSAECYVEVEGLSKTDTNRFFACCAAYPQLHSLLKSYAKTIANYKTYYADTDENEYCGVSVGGYALFALGLADLDKYAAAITPFIKKVADRYSTATDDFVKALEAKCGSTQQVVELKQLRDKISR